MITETTNKPRDIESFFKKNPDKFEERKNPTNKMIFIILLLLCIVLAIFPTIIPISVWIIRIAAIAGAIYCIFKAFLSLNKIFNKQSGGEVKDILVKKFDRDQNQEEDLVRFFEERDFAALAKAVGRDDQPIQLYIYEDKEGKEFYCQLMKYFSSSDFRGLSKVITISEPEYSQLEPDIRKIKNT